MLHRKGLSVDEFWAVAASAYKSLHNRKNVLAAARLFGLLAFLSGSWLE